MNTTNLFIAMLLLLGQSRSWAQQTFSDLPSLLAYAEQKSSNMKAGGIRLDQAKIAQLTAILGVIDPNGSLSFSYTTSTDQPQTTTTRDRIPAGPGSAKVQ